MPPESETEKPKRRATVVTNEPKPEPSQPEKTTMKPDLRKPPLPPPSQNPTPFTSSITTHPPSPMPSQPSKQNHLCEGLRPDVPDSW